MGLKEGELEQGEPTRDPGGPSSPVVSVVIAALGALVKPL